MNKRKVLFALIIVAALSSTLFIVVFYPYGTDFHFEEQIPEGENRAVVIRFGRLTDCLVDVSFVNDTSLMYSVDVILTDARFVSSSFNIDRMDDAGATEIWVWMGSLVVVSSHLPSFLARVHPTISSWPSARMLQ